MPNFMTVLSVGAELFHSDRHTANDEENTHIFFKFADASERYRGNVPNIYPLPKSVPCDIDAGDVNSGSWT